MLGSCNSAENEKLKASSKDKKVAPGFRWPTRLKRKSTLVKNDPEPEAGMPSIQKPGNRLRLAAVTVHAAVKISRMDRMKKRARWASKKLFVFVVSQVGLTCLVSLYAVAGGFIFQTLETEQPLENVTEWVAAEEEKFKGEFESLRDYHVEQLWNLTLVKNVLYAPSWKEEADMELKLFSSKLLEVVRKGSQTEESDEQFAASGWDYPRALLFAITIITTIGYGDTVPRTWQSKVVCVVYALFGIPLTLLCLANIGTLMASVYRFLWKNGSHLCLFLARAPERNNPQPETAKVRIPVLASLATMGLYIFLGATIFSSWENWTYLDGSYFCFITLSTVGFGDYVPGKNSGTFESNFKRVICALYLLFGLALLSMVFQLIQESVRVIVGRYASLLGLSDSKIKQDMEEEYSIEANEAPVMSNKSDAFSDAVLKLRNDEKKTSQS